jgi:glucuronate isomerase
MSFLDDNYLLQNESGRKIYEAIKDLPILDAHNHGDVREILDNNNWTDIWEVEAATDHYVWELMRKRGVPEEKITGDASNREKWMGLAEVFPELVGNPTYEWIHLDLKRRFGIEKPICKETAEDIWEATFKQLRDDRMRPQELLKEMNVEIMCTTDEPTSNLADHREAAEQLGWISIRPTWRPDKIMNIEKTEWKSSIEALGVSTDTEIDGLNGLLDALQKSHDYFDKHGCCASDHGVLEPIAAPVSVKEATKIYDMAMSEKELAEEEIREFKAFLMLQFGKMNEETDWVMQIHFGAMRDYRDKIFESLGPDSGGDISIQNIDIAGNLRCFLNEFDESLKIVLYHLDPTHGPTVATISRCFPNISVGAAWWYNDSPYGMEQQLRYLGTVDLLANHAGMVTDSRKLMSYGSRTEMFRRVLANTLGEMVEKGQMPWEPATELAKNISYYRPLKLFFE